MANWQHCPVVERANEQDGELWVFKGTSVPLYALYETLATGGTVDDFARRFGVGVEQAAGALEYEGDELHDYRLGYPDGVPWMHNPDSRPSGPNDDIWRTCQLVEQVSDILAGVWVFNRSRFTLYTIHYNLASGATVNDLGEWYCIEKEKVIAVLKYEAQALRESRLAYADTV